MIIRTVVLYLNYLRMKIKYRKQIWFRGFSVICALKGSDIQINPTGGAKRIHIFSHPFSNMIGLYQRCIIVAKFWENIVIKRGSLQQVTKYHRKWY